ncbi:MAG: methionine sulfoxide reductase catalytic subunit, partial [Pseudonocardiales bacterium]|nr:methionine sulfoxide reductase catalytic subunit [Pseudonocardiales bacterium]
MITGPPPKFHAIRDNLRVGARGIGDCPRVRPGRSRWFNLLWLLPIGFVVLIAGIALAKELRALPAVATFI